MSNVRARPGPYRAATTPIAAASAPIKTGVAAAARLWLTDAGWVEDVPPLELLLLPLPLCELEVVLEAELLLVMVPFFVLVMVDVLVMLPECEVVVVLVMTMEPVPEDLPVLVTEAVALYSTHSCEPTEAAEMRSEATVQAAIRQGAA